MLIGIVVLYVGILTWLTWVVIDGIDGCSGILFVNDWGDEKNSSKIVESLPCFTSVEVW